MTSIRLLHQQPSPSASNPASNPTSSSLGAPLEVSSVNFVELRCPDIINADGFAVPGPDCNAPLATLADGEEALGFAAEQELLSGDLVQVTLRVDEETAAALNATRRPRRNQASPSPAPSGHRRRQLLQQGADDDENDGMSSDPEPEGEQLAAALDESDDEYGADADADEDEGADQDGGDDEDDEVAGMQAVEDAASELASRPRRELRSAAAIARRQSPSGFKYVPGTLRIKRRGEQKEIYTGSPIPLRATIYLLDFCNWTNPYRSPEAFKKYVSSGNGSIENNLMNYYRTCSYGKSSFDWGNVTVIGPVQLPCKGNVSSGFLKYTFDASTKCGAAEQLSWVRGSEAYGQQLAATNDAVKSILTWTQRRRIMLILPAQAKCGWAGLADVACTSPTCRSYIKGGYASNDNIMYHELQHNYGLSHAGKGMNEYGDPTDPLGDYNAVGTHLQCHNAPNNYRIGWAKPVNEIPGKGGDGWWGNLTAGNFTAASNHLRFTIPASATSDENMVVVNLAAASADPTAARIAYPKYFLSYRVRNATAGAFDSGITSGYSNRLIIHAFNGSQSERDYNRSLLIDAGPKFSKPDPAFANGTVWAAPFVPYNAATGLGGGLRIRVLRTGPAAVEVDVCRMYDTREGAPGSEACYAGQDRDCDGLYGLDDPDCAGSR
ncbi:hypothetical protein HXX76_012506 [Chlamydomonas incerta]|uniref:Peptidase M11 gametolysin domain-containing protein n=1 Tax=Chlamydomonas incerta TaxID=51695 RepID=A0A835SWT3_CHLIN|nr:hypothetical protein HXX76_012506 [Chlamydomonas incerta]|eukprot:KAG2427311.1 hypothetical protein HXX76_012506 [Chlamydomonas incerta]